MRKFLLVSLVLAFVFLGASAVLAYDAGNDAVSRSYVDSRADFTIIDTNNPIPHDGVISEFEYYASNSNSFYLVLVDETDEVQWVSSELNHTSSGVYTLEPSPYVTVEAGWNLGVYVPSTGVIPHDKGGAPAWYTYAISGLPVVGQTISYENSSDRTYSLNATLFQPEGEILEPEDGEIVVGTTDLVATYDDGDDINDDSVSWAVREGTCAQGTNTVFGNVDSHNDTYNWDGENFSATWDTSGVAPGEYCFIFNPTDDPGQDDVRETREFFVADSYVHGGGHILEENGGKRKDWLDVSFGGWVADIGELTGEWQVNAHNVENNEYDKGKFHADSFSSLNLYPPTSDTCESAMNFTAHGTWNNEDNYTMIMRAGESGSPASAEPDDTVRITITGPDGFLLETSGQFGNESSCVGGSRTNLDNGNITIIDNN